jgi:hypothetical protein
MTKPTKRPPSQIRAPQVSLNVPEEIIASATLRDSSHCMIADAIRAAVPNARSITVDIQTIRWSDDNRELRYIYMTPRVAQLAIIEFDQGNAPAPFTFMLRGAQVTRMRRNRRKVVAPRPRHDLALPADPEDPRWAEAEAEALRRKTVVHSGAKNRTVADVTGGKAPPVSSFAKRREFGLRGLAR